MEIRALDPERDADACVAMLRAASPHIVINREAWLHRVATLGGGSYVAADGDVVLGESYAFPTLFGDTSTAMCMVTVAEPYRRHGIGSALFDAISAHFDETLIARFYENVAGTAFAETLNFRHVRSEAESVLDVAAFDGAVPDGVDLRAVSATDPHDAHAIDLEATRDMPTTEPFEELPYDEWEEHVLQHPLFTPEGSFVALVDGVAAAVSLIIADRESGRATSMFTGTLASYRGRGLARAVKLASIEWLVANGITQLVTTNDETNAPMLAVNRRLGFRPAGRRVDYLRGGTSSSPEPPAPAT